MTEPTAHNRSNGALKGFMERAEHLQNDKENLAMDFKEFFKEAKSAGWDPKYIRRAIKLKKINPADRQHDEEMTQTYLDAMGE